MRPLVAKIGVDPYGDGSTTQACLTMLWSIWRTEIDMYQMSFSVRQQAALAFQDSRPEAWFQLKDVVQEWTED